RDQEALPMAAAVLGCSAVAKPPTLRGKLVRDRVPEIIRQAGLVPITEPAPPHLLGQYVDAKLQEELHEYLTSGDVEELADLIEVCFAAAKCKGVSPEQLLEIAREKRDRRGGFSERMIWFGNHSDR
ncbi:MAG TPA: nucleoside triphosphate pyrophosphohydrolase, partial [Micromonosporaceae bacterium]